MGGIAIVGATVVGYLVAHIRTEQSTFATPGWTLLVADRRARRRRLRRRLPRRARPAGTSGCASGARRSASSSSRRRSRCSRSTSCTRLDAPVVHAAARPRPRHGRLVRAARSLVVYATANAVNLTDGLDGLAAGSSAFVFAAFVIIAFWQFRHPDVYHVLPRRRARPRDRRGRDARRVRWVPVVERRARRRSSWATPARSRSAARWRASRCSRDTTLLLPILGGLYVVETLSVIAQVISFRGFHRRVLRMAPIHHHFEVGGWPEFTVIVRFWLFAGHLRRARRSASSTPTSSTSSGVLD